MPRKDTIGPLKRKAEAGGFAFNKAFKQAVAEAYDFQADDPRFNLALKMARRLIGGVSENDEPNGALGKVLHFFDMNLELILCCEEYHKQADRDYSNLLEGNRG